jgi:hypothetical protein
MFIQAGQRLAARAFKGHDGLHVAEVVVVALILVRCLEPEPCGVQLTGWTTAGIPLEKPDTQLENVGPPGEIPVTH